MKKISFISFAIIVYGYQLAIFAVSEFYHLNYKKIFMKM